MIGKRGKGLVETELAVAVPEGCCEFVLWVARMSWSGLGADVPWVGGGLTDGRIAPRSGLAVKSFIDTGAGVIDADYRGQVKVLLFNHSEADFEGV